MENAEITPILIPDPIDRTQWALPIGEQTLGIEQKSKLHYETYEEYLTGMGFEKIYETQSIRHDDINKINVSHLPVETITLWHHQAGIIVTLFSKTVGGNILSDGTRQEVVKKFGSLTVSARLDLGTGKESQHRAVVAIKDAGSTTPQLDGSKTRNVQDIMHDSEGSLTEFLERNQPHGKFIPLSEWSGLNGKMFLPIGNEFIYPVLNSPIHEKKGYIDILGGQDKDALMVEFLAKLPRRVARAIETANINVSSYNHDNDNVDESINVFSEALALGGKRWRDTYDNRLLRHWNEVASGLHGRDISKWRAYEEGEAGLSLPVALLYAGNTSGSDSRLKYLLEQAPLDVLKRWATVPDATGYTFGLHLVSRVFVEGWMMTQIPEEGLITNALRILHDRLGPEGIVMTTQTRSILGIPMQFDEASHKVLSKNEMKNSEESHSEMVDIVMLLNEWGIPWDRHLRGRNYPNTMAGGEKDPHFFKLDGPVDWAAWKETLGRRYTDALDPIVSLMKLRDLNEVMMVNTSGVSSARIKM